MIRITAGDAHDVASIMHVMETAFSPAFGEAWSASQCLSALALPECRLLIARDEQGEVTGFAISRWVLETEELLMIGVDPRRQKSRIGTALVKEIVDRASDAGRERLFLEVREDNPAHRFYANHGFVPIGRRRQYYRGNDGQLSDAITMALDL